MKKQTDRILSLILSIILMLTTSLTVLADVDIYETEGTAQGEVTWEALKSNSPNLSYTGSWSQENDGDIVAKGTVEDGASVTLQFYGTGIRWYGQKDTNFAIANVKIDEEDVTSVDTYGTGEEVHRGHVLYERTNLDANKVHTITISHSGTQHPSANEWNGGYTIDVEQIEVANETNTPSPSDISISGGTSKVSVGASFQLTAVKQPFNASGTITWESKDAKVAMVSETGVVQAVAKGTTQIIAKCGTTSKAFDLTVIEQTQEIPEIEYEVSREKPLYIENFYWTQTTEYTGNPQLETPLAHTPADLWAAVPEDMKQYTVINLIAEQSLENKATVTDWIKKYAAICDQNNIPYMIQTINGETRASRRIPVSFFEEIAENSSNLMGFNAAELYNSPAFFGDGAEGDHSGYVAETVNMCARNGIYWVWTDSNCFGTHGVLQDWIEQNTELSIAMRTYKANVIMMYKQTHATVAAEGLDLGLWIADYCDNWGVSSDWWYWGNAKGGLYGAQGTSTTSGNCALMPEVMFAQDMIRVMSYGGTCFLSEAAFFSNSLGDLRTPTYQYVILPLLEKVTSGGLHIPNKQEVVAKQITAVVGQKIGDRYAPGFEWAKTINYDLNNSEIYPSTSKYNLICTIPYNTPQSGLDKFANLYYELPSKAQLDKNYTTVKAEGTAWVENNQDTWYWMNSIENRKESQYSNIVPKTNGADMVRIESEPHTYVVLTETANEINVYTNNYRLDKSNLYGTNFPEQRWYPYITELNQQMLAGTLTDTDKRDTYITVKNAVKPTLEFITKETTSAYKSDDYTRPYSYTMTLKEGTTDEWLIDLKHNGTVEFNIVTGDATVEPTSIELSKTNAEVGRNKNIQLTAKIMPENAGIRKAQWESLDEDIATVDETGLVTGVKEGTTTIKAKVTDTIFATCTIKVNELKVTQVVPSKDSVIINDGESEQVTASVLPELNSDDSLVWSSNNEAIATVDQRGLIKGIAPGTTTIVIQSAYEAKAEIVVTVKYIEEKIMDRSTMIASASSQQSGTTEGPAANVLDDDMSTIWHSDYTSADVPTPHWIKVMFEQETKISKVSYVPRKGASNGTILGYKLYIINEQDEEVLVSTGTWSKDETEKEVVFDAVVAKGIRIEATSSVGNFGSAAEVYIYQNMKQDFIEPDKSQLKTTIDKANGYKAAEYTKESFKVLQDALKEAITIYDNEKATEEEVTKTTENLKAAINALVKVTLNGWKIVNGKWKFYKNNVAYKNKWYQANDKKWYYLGADEFMVTKWKKISNTWYYFDAKSGAMKTGWFKDGSWYYLNGSGKMTTGWQKVGGKWYYLNPSNGKMLSGWQKINNVWYYMKASGVMATGWQKVGGTWYYLNTNGYMKTGWLKLGKKWYYLKSNGAMVTGRVVINNKVNYFTKDGVWLR